MSTITKYGFEDEDGESSFTCTDYEEAAQHAREQKLLLVAHVYKWSEDERLEDNREQRCELCTKKTNKDSCRITGNEVFDDTEANDCTDFDRKPYE